MNHYQTIDFKPFPNILLNFLKIENPAAKNVRELIRKTKNSELNIVLIHNKYQVYLDKYSNFGNQCKNDRRTRSSGSGAQNPKRKTPEMFYLTKRFTKLHQKFIVVKRAIYQNVLSLVGFMLEFIRDMIKKNVPVTVFEKEFEDYLTSMVNDECTLKYENRMKSLRSKIESLSVEVSSKEILKQQLQIASTHYIPKLEYLPYSSFDEYFYDYINDSPTLLNAMIALSNKFKLANGIAVKQSKICEKIFLGYQMEVL